MDDDVNVEVEGEGEVPLQNQTPEVVVSALSTVLTTVQSYGWFLILALAVGYYFRNKLRPTLEKLARKKEERDEYKKYDTDATQVRLEAMERARQRLQEQFNDQAAKYTEEQKIKEEAARKAKIEDWEGHQLGKGYRSKFKPEEPKEPSSSSSSKPKPKQKLRPADYNPLTGGGAGGGSNFSYRPTRRGGDGGG